MAITSAPGLRSLGVSGAFLGLISFVTLERGSWIVITSVAWLTESDRMMACKCFRCASSNNREGLAPFKLSAYHLRKKEQKAQANCGSQGGRGKLSCGRNLP